MAGNRGNIADKQLKVATLNIRGLRNLKKRSAVFRTLRLEKLDVIALQETYLLDSDYDYVKKQWGGMIHQSSGTNRSKGLCTIFHSRFEEKDVQLIFKNDRMIISSLNVDKNKIFFVNIYSPCIDVEKPAFYDDLQAEIRRHVQVDDDIICLGDFNIAVEDVDTVAGAKHSENIRQCLRNFCSTLGMADTWRMLHPHEKSHTWSRGNPVSARRLDYILIGESLISFLKDSIITSIGFSDHRMVVSTIEFAPFKLGKGLFKLNASLLEDKDFCHLIVKEIQSTKEDYNELNPHLLWEVIKINTKEIAQQYSRFKASEKRNRRGALLNFLENSMGCGNDKQAHIVQEITKIKREFEIEELHRVKGAQKRARVRWMEEGEKCTKYFLSLEKSRSNANTVKKLRNNDGGTVTGEEEIVEEIGSYFERVYNQNEKSDEQILNNFQGFVNEVIFPSLSENEVEMCDTPITIDEVAAALKSMKNGSAPGSDGLPVEFYKVFWQHIRSPLMECYNYSFAVDNLSPTEREAVISLIHKGKNLPRDCLSNWRPISLTNVDYKILAKTLSLRLSTVIGDLIGDQQVGFIKGRKISTIHREIDDILEYQRVSRSCGILLALDFKQAFDSINTVFILESLRNFGFGPNFVKWISILNADRLTCVKNGGHISRMFKMNNGVRQGCPISPQLFILAVEVLAQKVIQSNLVNGIKTVEESDPLKIRQYADDTTLFLKDQHDMIRAMSILDEFSTFSGLSLNVNKSFAMVTDARTETAEINEIRVRDTIKILGLYFSNSKSAGEITANWTSKIDCLLRTLEKWARRDLSILGKLHLIKTFGITQFNFIMQSIALPRSVLEEINRILFRFLWKKRFTNRRAFEKVKRKVMCNDLHNGGLKMVDIFNRQNAILLGWAEELLKPDLQPWKKLAGYFFRDLGGLSVFKSDVPLKQFKGAQLISSSFWKQVLEKWLLFSDNDLQGIKSRENPIFNNNNVRYAGQIIFLPSCIQRGIILAEDVSVQDRIMTKEEFLEKVGTYPRCLLDYNILYNALKNKFNWNALTNQNNGFSFKGSDIGSIGRRGFYMTIIEQASPLCINIWERRYGETIDKKHWQIVHSLKESRLKTLAWKILHNIYPTNILLHKMKLKESPSCEFCGVPDFIEHFFYQCQKVKKLWVEIEKELQSYLNCSIRITEKTVLIGDTGSSGNNRRELNQINKIIAIGKLTVSKFKYGKATDIVALYRAECCIRNIWDTAR